MTNETKNLILRELALLEKSGANKKSISNIRKFLKEVSND